MAKARAAKLAKLQAMKESQLIQEQDETTDEDSDSSSDDSSSSSDDDDGGYVIKKSKPKRRDYRPSRWNPIYEKKIPGCLTKCANRRVGASDGWRGLLSMAGCACGLIEIKKAKRLTRSTRC